MDKICPKCKKEMRFVVDDDGHGQDFVGWFCDKCQYWEDDNDTKTMDA